MKNIYIFDAPVYYSELLKKYGTREAVVAYLLARCNEIGKIDADALGKEKIVSEPTKVN